MKVGMTFQFNDQTDFTLAEAIIDCASQQKFAAGQIEVQSGGKAIGVAGQVSSKEVAETVAQGSFVTMAVEMNDNEYGDLKKEVANVNQNLRENEASPVFYTNILSIAPR